MNVLKLNEHISGDKSAVEEILFKLHCENIKYNPVKNEFRFSREEGKNPTASRIDVNSLKYQCFSTGKRGSIYNLIMEKKHTSFPESLKWAAKTLKISDSSINEQIQLPFGGFYKNITRFNEEPENALKIYPADILNEFGRVNNMAFFKDGISFCTQEKFNLGYDLETNRITIPQWNINGELVGVMGRANDTKIPYEYRWLPIIPCSRSYTLYGYHVNYGGIQENQLCVITESEKGVMQLSSMGHNLGVATCTNTISSLQAKFIKALRVDKIVIAYDEGIEEDKLITEAEKLKSNNPIYTNKVGYIFDKQCEILPKGSKDSPTDLGKSKFEFLANKYVRWI